MIHRAGWITAAVVAATVAALASRALAQEVLSPSLGMYVPAFTGRDIRLLRTIAGIDREQMDVVVELFSGYRLQMKNARGRFDRLVARGWEDMELGAIDQPQLEKIRDFETARFMSVAQDAEKSLLGDIHLILRQDQEASWERYLRARRAMAIERTDDLRYPMLESVLLEFGLTEDEHRTLKATLEQERAELDKPVSVFLRDSAMYEEARRKSRSPGGQPVDEALVARIADGSAALHDRVTRSLRMIASQLGGQRGEALTEFYEQCCIRRRMGEPPVADQRPFNELRSISTLTADQKKEMDALLRAAEGAWAIIFKEHAALRTEARFKPQANPQRYQDTHNEAQKQWVERQSRLKTQVRAILTDEQRRAYDDGDEPPMSWDSMWFERRREDEGDRGDW